MLINYYDQLTKIKTNETTKPTHLDGFKVLNKNISAGTECGRRLPGKLLITNYALATN